MGASKEVITSWLRRGIQKKATHVISVCDTFGNDDYPVYVMPVENVREVAQQYAAKSMQRINEVYHLGMDINLQLAEDRAMHYEMPGEEPKMSNGPKIRDTEKILATRMVLSELQCGNINIDQCINRLDQINQNQL